MNAGFNADGPWWIFPLTVEKLSHVSSRHIHPVEDTCLLEVPQEVQVMHSAFVVSSGIAGGKGAPLMPHQLGVVRSIISKRALQTTFPLIFSDQMSVM